MDKKVTLDDLLQKFAEAESKLEEVSQKIKGNNTKSNRVVEKTTVPNPLDTITVDVHFTKRDETIFKHAMAGYTLTSEKTLHDGFVKQLTFMKQGNVATKTTVANPWKN
jgi:hypothetical protein